jgi:hypothetical protein
MASTIFNLGAVKLLKKILRFQESDIQIITGNNADPTVSAVDAVSGSMYMQDGTQNVYIKQDNGSTTNWALVSTSAALANYIPTSEKAAALGVATLDAGGKVPAAQLPNSVMDYKGNWDAATNTPTLADGTGNAGDVYRVNTAGTQDLGSGSQVFSVGDWVVYSGAIWQKSSNSNAVMSVNGLTGVVVLDTDDIAEGGTNFYYTTARFNTTLATKTTDDLAEGATNLYFTNARAISAVDLSPYLKADGTVAMTANFNANSNKIINVTNPTAAQDAATKDYTDTALALKANIASPALTGTPTAPTAAPATNTTQIATTAFVQSEIASIGSGANVTLSNLTSPVAFNQDLIPGSNNTRDVGSSANKIKDVHAATLTNGSAVVDMVAGTIANSSGQLTVDFENRQLQQGTFISANWDSIGLDLYDAVNANNGRIAGLGNIQLATGTNLNALLTSNRTTALAAAGVATVSITSSRFYVIKYRASRASGGNDCKVGTLHIAKEAAGNNTNAAINDTYVATNVSMDDLTFAINASGNLEITNSTAYSVDLRYEIHQL